MKESAGKVLMLVENLSVPFDRRVWMEATTLVRSGYGVCVICPRGEKDAYYEMLEGIYIYRFPLPSLPGLLGHLLEYALALSMTFILSLFVWLRRGFDVIHSANPPDFFFLIAAFYRPFGKRFIFDHHDLVPETCLTRWRGIKQRVLYRFCTWCEGLTFRTADAVISTNHSYRMVALRRGRVQKSKVFVVRSGPSLNKFVRREPDPTTKGGRQYLACYLGVMGPNDGVDYVIDVAQHIVDVMKRRDVTFALIGSGDLFQHLVDRAKRLRLDGYVRFLGRIPDEEVLRYLSSADIGIAPDPKDALNDLSTMNKIVEYMALGLPVVCFDLVEARVTAGEAGAFAKPNDVPEMARLMLQLLDDPERRRSMADAARNRFITTLAWEHQIPQLLAAYNSLTV